jgi:GTP cyclohydrolase II
MQLQDSLQRVAAEGRGMLLYLRQEGRRIRLQNKIRAYALQVRLLTNNPSKISALRNFGITDDDR